MLKSSRKLNRAVLATTSDDSHIWNLVGVQLMLEERGFDVVNLGACTPSGLIVETVIKLCPELLVISSINGHGAISLKAMMSELKLCLQSSGTLLVAGGLLCTGPAHEQEMEQMIMTCGCAGVFSGDDAWQCFDSWWDQVSLDNVSEAEIYGHARRSR